MKRHVVPKVMIKSVLGTSPGYIYYVSDGAGVLKFKDDKRGADGIFYNSIVSPSFEKSRLSQGFDNKIDDLINGRLDDVEEIYKVLLWCAGKTQLIRSYGLKYCSDICNLFDITTTNKMDELLKMAARDEVVQTIDLFKGMRFFRLIDKNLHYEMPVALCLANQIFQQIIINDVRFVLMPIHPSGFLIGSTENVIYDIKNKKSKEKRRLIKRLIIIHNKNFINDSFYYDDLSVPREIAFSAKSDKIVIESLIKEGNNIRKAALR